MPAPRVVHALTSLNEPEPRCGAAGLFLAAAIDPQFVTCPACRGEEPATDIPISHPTKRAAMSEKAFRQEVLTTAKEAGWRAYFTWTSIHSPAGFPDLILCKPGHPLLAVELKTAKGRLSKAQREWLEALAQVTDVVACVWRPDDSHAIERLLRAHS